MPGNNLEQQLGELTGQLKALVPALDRMEERQNASDKLAAGEQARHDALRREFDDFRKKVSNRLGDLYKKAETYTKESEIIRGSIKTVSDDVGKLKEKEAGTAQKVWDLLKIILAGLLGAALTWLVSGRK